MVLFLLFSLISMVKNAGYCKLYAIIAGSMVLKIACLFLSADG